MKMIALMVCLLIAGVWGDCQLDVQSCLSTFSTKINADTNNIVQSCQDGDDVLACLRRTGASPECASVQSQIQAQIEDATQKLVASGCNPDGGADACLTGLQNCQNKLQTEIATVDRSSEAAQCKVAQDFLSCLQAISCSGDNQSKVQSAIQKVVTDEHTAHCV